MIKSFVKLTRLSQLKPFSTLIIYIDTTIYILNTTPPSPFFEGGGVVVRVYKMCYEIVYVASEFVLNIKQKPEWIYAQYDSWQANSWLS